MDNDEVNKIKFKSGDFYVCYWLIPHKDVSRNNKIVSIKQELQIKTNNEDLSYRGTIIDYLDSNLFFCEKKFETKNSSYYILNNTYVDPTTINNEHKEYIKAQTEIYNIKNSDGIQKVFSSFLRDNNYDSALIENFLKDFSKAIPSEVKRKIGEVCFKGYDNELEPQIFLTKRRAINNSILNIANV